MDLTNLLSTFGAAASGYHDAAHLESQRANEEARFKTDQAGREMQNEQEQMQLAEQRRQFQAAAEDRAIAQQYARESASGRHAMVGEDGAVGYTPPAPPAPAAAPAPAAPAAPVAPVQTAGLAGQPTGAPVPPAPNGSTGLAGTPPATPQPTAVSAIPGQTLSFTPPAAPVTPANAPTTPAGAPSLAQPKAAPKDMPTGPTRAGLLDQLAQAALKRGDVALYNQRIAEKQRLRSEGIGEAAHMLLSGATNAEIERAFNSNGSGRIMPGSLVNHGDGTVSAVGVDPETGKTWSINHYNLVHAAMGLGMIAPPTVQSHPATDRQTITGPDGTVTTLSEGGKYSAIAIRGLGAYVYNQSTGQGHLETPEGGTALLNPTQAAGMREIAQINNQVAGRRAQQIPGQEGNKPPLNESRVIGDASAIWLNNSALMKGGHLNPARAHEIAVAINDKDPAVQVGQQRNADTGRMWNVAKYKGVTYAIAESADAGRFVDPPRNTIAPASANPPAATAAPAPVPRPAAAAAEAAAPAAPDVPDTNANMERYGTINDRLETMKVGRQRSANNAKAQAAFDKQIAELQAEQNALKVSPSQFRDYQAARMLASLQSQYDHAVKMFGANSNQALNLKEQIDKKKAPNVPAAPAGRLYARGGVVSGGRGSEMTTGPKTPVKDASGEKVLDDNGNFVKSRSFKAPPRARISDDAPIVKPVNEAPIVGNALDDGVTVKPMTTPEDDEQTPLPDKDDTPLALLADPVIVSGKMDDAGNPDVTSLRQQNPIRIRSFKQPPARNARA